MNRLILLLAMSVLPLLALAAEPATAQTPIPDVLAPTPDVTAQKSKDIADRLNALAPLFRVPAPVVPESLMPQAGDDCAVELVLVIDDYEARSRKEYNLIGGEEVEDTVNAALELVPGVVDARMKSAVGYCEMRRVQPFVMTRKGGMLSMARMMRSFMLGSLLEGVEEDTWGIVSAIDAHTASMHPKVELLWEKPLE